MKPTAYNNADTGMPIHNEEDTDCFIRFIKLFNASAGIKKRIQK